MITMHDLNIGSLDFEFCRDFPSNFFDRDQRISSKYRIFRIIGIQNSGSVFKISNGETIQDHQSRSFEKMTFELLSFHCINPYFAPFTYITIFYRLSIFALPGLHSCS